MLPRLKWYVLALLIVLLCALISVAIGYCKTKASGPTWQSSQSLAVQLGVRDKYGELTAYEAEFVVTDPEGGQHKARKRVIGDEWGFVWFPEDFRAVAKPGKYTWKCTVKKQEVVKGRFEFGSGKSYADQAQVD